MPVLNLVVAVLRGSIGRVIAVMRDRLLLLSLLVERFVLTLINEDYFYYYYLDRESDTLPQHHRNTELA